MRDLFLSRCLDVVVVYYWPDTISPSRTHSLYQGMFERLRRNSY